jgi:hypothetical protein
MLKSLEYWRDFMARLGLPEMPIAKVELHRPASLPSRAEMLKVARRLLRYAYYEKMPELASAGMPVESVALRGRGRFPDNIAVCCKNPPEYGGALEFANMFIVRRYPFKAMLENFSDSQLGDHLRESGAAPGQGFVLPPEMFVPSPPGVVFLPALKGLSGAGGNATTDKMTEIGSTLGLAEEAAEAAAKAEADAAAIAAAKAAAAASKGRK